MFTAETMPLLSEDVSYLLEVIKDSANYSFSSDLRKHMVDKRLSSVQLGKRALVSHTTVDKWLNGRAKPNGKERMKELGMALGMDVDALNQFLYNNGYPKLYVKNPLDSAAKFLLSQSAGAENIVVLYRSQIGDLQLDKTLDYKKMKLSSTFNMSQDLSRFILDGRFSVWYNKHRNSFTANAKKQLLRSSVSEFLKLYLGDTPIYQMVNFEEFPSAAGGLLYPMFRKHTVKVNGLRTKLIAIGLYANMTVDEIDELLICAELRPLSDPLSRVDFILLNALCMAHDRYPGYEYENLERITAKLKETQENSILLEEYTKRLEQVKKMVEYYDAHTDTMEDTRIFQMYYTSYSDHCVMDYICDIFLLLAEKGAVDKQDILPLLQLIERKPEE